MDTHDYQRAGNDFDSLSFRDLLDARDVYHTHLVNYPHVVATAIGRYRIRTEDSWPEPDGTVKHKGTGPRTLGNSEVRPYSWPAILVFVDEWVDVDSFGKDKRYDPSQMVPRTLFLPNGRKAPVCVTLVEKVAQAPATRAIRFPLNNIGGGNPIIADVQGREHVATIACLVSDGHRTYALTNRHVAGDAGEVLYSRLNGRNEPIGRSSPKQLTRLPFAEVYRDCPGKDVYVNLDAGLIDIDDLGPWTAQVHGIGAMGPLTDLPPSQLKLSLVGCRVVGFGAASGRMEGEITALLYRYKSVGGFEYLADCLIGPRTGRSPNGPVKKAPAPEFLTRPGDSGTLWVFDPVDSNPAPKKYGNDAPPEYRPFALQWGAQVFAENVATSYALATSLSTVCNLLDVDLVRDWNLDQVDTWGAIGHFSIAASVAANLTNAHLKTLMTKNAEIVSPSSDDIRNSEFKGMGSAEFVPLADVPDMFWKPRVAHQGFARAMEGPNHFADMDQEGADGKTLLDLTQDPGFIDPDRWNAFYASLHDLLSGEPIAAKHRGLLPFRVWQIFNDMVRFVKAGKVAEFVCAAGVLTHYLGDACQPLHISYLHDGDPEQPQSRTIHHQNGTVETVQEPLGSGVHSAYEDAMVSDNRDKVLDGLAAPWKVKAAELIESGSEAAQATIAMMRTVFERIPPRKIVQFYIDSDAKPKQLAEDMWAEFGAGTVECMRDGAHLLAVLWQSAWVAGDGDQTIPAASLKALTQKKAMKICQDEKFLPSVSIARIGDILRQPV
ncbi:MAG: hypothetical protein U0836_21240 [Pirellulales bacterium]